MCKIICSRDRQKIDGREWHGIQHKIINIRLQHTFSMQKKHEISQELKGKSMSTVISSSFFMKMFVFAVYSCWFRCFAKSFPTNSCYSFDSQHVFEVFRQTTEAMRSETSKSTPAILTYRRNEKYLNSKLCQMNVAYNQIKIELNEK